MAIPKIIHQTWKDEVVPDQWSNYQKKVKALHPDWEYRLWTDEDNDAFMLLHYPELIELFRAYPKPVMRADVIRYAIMDQMGGVYLDLDYEMIKPFVWKGSCVLPLSRSTNYGDSENRLGNCIMASEAGHPFWKKVLKEIDINKQVIGLDELDVEKATGPLLLTRVYQEGNWPDIETPDRIFFHPPTPKSEKDYKLISDNGKSFGMHHAHGSWRKSLLKRVWDYFFG